MIGTATFYGLPVNYGIVKTLRVPAGGLASFLQNSQGDWFIAVGGVHTRFGNIAPNVSGGFTMDPTPMCDDRLTNTVDKINTIIMAHGLNVEPFCDDDFCDLLTIRTRIK